MRGTRARARVALGAVGGQERVGGLGEGVARALLSEGVASTFRHIGLPDEFLDAGALPTLHDRYGLSIDAVCTSVKDWLE